MKKIRRCSVESVHQALTVLSVFFSPCGQEQAAYWSFKFRITGIVRHLEATRPFRSVHFSPRDRFRSRFALRRAESFLDFPRDSKRSKRRFVRRHCPTSVTFSSGSGNFTTKTRSREGCFFFFCWTNVSKRLDATSNPKAVNFFSARTARPSLLSP